MSDVIRKLIAEQLPQHQAWLQWWADEHDPINPYHEYWDPDFLDQYNTGNPIKPAFWTATMFAVMCDAQQWMNRTGSIVNLIR